MAKWSDVDDTVCDVEKKVAKWSDVDDTVCDVEKMSPSGLM